VLDDGTEGRQIAVKDRHRAFGFEWRGEAADDVLIGDVFGGGDGVA
jgi:hypothetical protein